MQERRQIPNPTGLVAAPPTGFTDAGGRIPNLAGVKYTHETLAAYFEALRLDHGRYDMLWGRDEMLLGALAMINDLLATGSILQALKARIRQQGSPLPPRLGRRSWTLSRKHTMRIFNTLCRTSSAFICAT